MVGTQKKCFHKLATKDFDEMDIIREIPKIIYYIYTTWSLKRPHLKWYVQNWSKCTRIRKRFF